MSTYYYAICDEHRAVSDVIGGRSFPDRWWQNDGDELAAFLEAHNACRMEIVSEHDDRSTDYIEVTVEGSCRHRGPTT